MVLTTIIVHPLVKPLVGRFSTYRPGREGGSNPPVGPTPSPHRRKWRRLEERVGRNRLHWLLGAKLSEIDSAAGLKPFSSFQTIQSFL